LTEALPKHCQTEGNEMMRAHIPMGNEEPQDIFKRHGFKRSRIINLEKTFDR
jgi:hypothetical protein